MIDAGAKEPTFMPASAVGLGRGATRDLAREPAMTVVDATLGLEAGIALAMSLAEGPTRTGVDQHDRRACGARELGERGGAGGDLARRDDRRVLGVPVFFTILIANKRRAGMWGRA